MESIGGRLFGAPGDVMAELLLSPDRGETIREVGKDILDLASFGMSNFVDALLDRKQTTEETAMAGAFAGLGLFVTKPGRGLMKYAYKGLVKAPLDIAFAPIKYADRKLEPVTKYIWENIVVPPFKARVIPTFERMAGSQGAFERINKSVADIMQPAVERMGKNLATTFRTIQAMKANVTRIGERLGRELKDVNPTARYEVMKGLRGTSLDSLKTSEAREVLSRFDTAIHDAGLKTPYEVEFRERLGKLLAKEIDSPQDIFTGEAPYEWLKGIEEGATGTLFMSKTRRSLIQAIEDPLVAPEFKALAMELHNLPARLPEEVAAASKDASTAYLASKLKGWKGVVRAYPPLGREGDFLKSKWTPFAETSTRGSLYVQRDVELELRCLQDIPKMAHGIFNKFFMSPWKMMKVMDRPAGQMRNLFGNTWLNHIGGLPFWHLEPYIQAGQGLLNRGNRIADVKRFLRTSGQGGNFSVNDIVGQLEGMKYGASLPDRALTLFNQIQTPFKATYNANETLFKTAKYLHNLDKGMSHSEATWDAVKWTFNYGEITRATAGMRTYVAPFFTWQSKIIPLMAEAAVKNPVQFTAMITFYQMLQSNAIQAAGITEDEWPEVEKTFPQYIQDGMFLMMPWRDDKGQLNLANMTYAIPGFGDISDIKARPFSWFLSNPVVTISSALLSNKRFSGAPLTYEWEEPGTKFAKQAAYVWEQLMPAIAPGGTDWNMMSDMFTDVPEALSGPQALSSLLGFKISPVDLDVASRRTESLKRIHLAEMGSAMKQELRRARTDEERQKIIEKYAELRPHLLGVEEE